MDSSNKKYLSVDEILIYIGECGPFQWLLLSLLFLLSVVPAFQVMVLPLAAINPPWKCIYNSSICLLNGTFPSSDNRRCHMDREEWTYVETLDYSIPTHFDLYCDRGWMMQLVMSVHCIGFGFGAIVFGWVGDNYGRKKVIILSHVLTLLVGFISAFLPNITVFAISRFIVSSLVQGNYCQTVILIGEFVTSKQRALVCQLVTLAYPISTCLLVLKAYFIREWKTLFILSTAPYIFLVIFYKFIPESIRWLRLQGELEKISTIVGVIAQRNGKAMPEDIEVSPVGNYVLDSRTSVIEIFRTKKLAIQSVLLGYCWFAVLFVYLGIYLAASNLGGNIYRDFTILTVADIPSYFLVIYFCERVGRKKTFICSVLAGGVAYMSIAFIPSKDNLKSMIIILATAAKLLMNMGVMCLYQWSIEIYPTKVRAVGLGFVEVCGRFGTSVSPWIANGLHSLSEISPFIVMGLAAIIAAFLALPLPETRGKATTECNEETENIRSYTNTENNVEMSGNSI